MIVSRPLDVALIFAHLSKSLIRTAENCNNSKEERCSSLSGHLIRSPFPSFSCYKHPTQVLSTSTFHAVQPALTFLQLWRQPHSNVHTLSLTLSTEIQTHIISPTSRTKHITTLSPSFHSQALTTPSQPSTPN